LFAFCIPNGNTAAAAGQPKRFEKVF